MIEKASEFKPERSLTIDERRYGVRLLGGDAVGSTSFIYLAYQLDPPDDRPAGPPLILKRFLQHGEQGSRFFRVEEAVLEGAQGIETSPQKCHLPRKIATAEKQFFGGEPSDLLLMEFAPGTPADSFKPMQEREALLLIAQYLEALITVARAGYTCWDRKLQDLFWTPPESRYASTERLMVIDWNMAEDWTPERMRNDLNRTGLMLYELLTGAQALRRAGSLSYDLQPRLTGGSGTVEQRIRPWGRLSFGAQRLIESLLAAPRDAPAALGEEKPGREYMIRWTQQLTERCRALAALWLEDVKPLMDRAARLVEQAKLEPSTDRTAPLVEQAKQKQWAEVLEQSSIAVLIEDSSRNPAAEGQQPDGWLGLGLQLERYNRVHELARANVLKQRDYLHQVRQQLETGDTRGANASLQDLLAGGANLTLEEELSTLRWLLLDYAWPGAPLDVSTAGKIVETMRRLEKALNAGEANAALVASDLALLGVTQTDLTREATARQLVADATQAQRRRDYAGAATAYRQAAGNLGGRPGETVEGRFWESQEGATRRFWMLVRQSLGELGQLAEDAEKLAIAVQLPGEALTRAGQFIEQLEFAQATKELKAGLRADPSHEDLAKLHRLAIRLAYLQWLAGDMSAEVLRKQPLFERSIDDLLDMAIQSGKLLSDLPEDSPYSAYPRAVEDALSKAYTDILTKLRHPEVYPGDLTEALNLQRQAQTLRQLLSALPKYHVGLANGPDATAELAPLIEQLDQLLRQLDQHLVRLQILKDLNEGSHLTQDQRVKVLRQALALGVTRLPNAASQDQDVLAQLKELKQISAATNQATAEDKARALAAQLRADLPRQTNWNDTWELLDAAIISLRSVLPVQNQDGLGQRLLNWLTQARATLPGIVAEVMRLRSAWSDLPRSYEPRVWERAEKLQMNIDKWMAELRSQEALWPAELSPRPELERLQPQTDLSALWGRRFEVLKSRLPGIPIPAGELARTELLLGGLRECGQQPAFALPGDADELIARYESALHASWAAFYQDPPLPNRAAIRTEVSAGLARSAEKLFRHDEEPLQALWLAVAAAAAAGDGANRSQPSVEAILAHLESPELLESVKQELNLLFVSLLKDARFPPAVMQAIETSAIYTQLQQQLANLHKLLVELRKHEAFTISIQLQTQVKTLENKLNELRSELQKIPEKQQAPDPSTSDLLVATQGKLERIARKADQLTSGDLLQIKILLGVPGVNLNMESRKRLLERVSDFGLRDASTGMRNPLREQQYAEVMTLLNARPDSEVRT